MEETDFALKMYESANAQFLMRVRQRDSVLLFFVAAVSTIFGLTSDQGVLGDGFMLAIPYVGCVCGIMIAYHSLFIEALMKYSQVELAGLLGDRRVFENSPMFTGTGMLAVQLRSTAYVLLLVLPVAFALWETYGGVSRWLWNVSLVLGGTGVTAVLVADVSHVVKVRKRIRQNPDPDFR